MKASQSNEDFQIVYTVLCESTDVKMVNLYSAL